MATGVNTKLTGQIGEHLVSAVMGAFGYYASPYSGNVPRFDVAAVHSKTLRSFPVQVKASTSGSLVHSTIDKWCEHSIIANNQQTIGELKDLDYPSLIWVMVRVESADIRNARFFICTEADIQRKIVKRYTDFMERHNYRRPGGGTSKQAVLNIDELIEFEDNWHILPDSLLSHKLSKQHQGLLRAWWLGLGRARIKQLHHGSSFKQIELKQS